MSKAQGFFLPGSAQGEKKYTKKMSRVVHACNPSPQKTETERLLQERGQRSRRTFQSSQGHLDTPCNKNKTKLKGCLGNLGKWYVFRASKLLGKITIMKQCKGPGLRGCKHK